MVRNSKFDEKEIKNGLYLVSTPIGNLGDITLRAINILKKSEYVLCEDTRVSQILLKKYEINTKLISYHKFNEKKNLSKILNLLKGGKIISLISDAGTPSISDPGAILVNECIQSSIEVFPVPGPSSVISAISISGFSDKFFFYGFFPEKEKTQKKDLKILSNIDSSIVFFISSKKITKIIPLIKKNFADREILICREMTKYFEEFFRSSVENLQIRDLTLKGELTIVISEKKNDNKISQSLSESDKRIIKQMLGKMSVKDIINVINKNNDISKKEIYNYCVTLKNEN